MTEPTRLVESPSARRDTIGPESETGAAARGHGKHRRDAPCDDEADSALAHLVRDATSAAFEQARYEKPEDAYVVLIRELEQRGILPDVAASFDAALQISGGLRPLALRVRRWGRHRRCDP